MADSSVTTFIPDANVWQAARLWHDTNGLKAAGGVRKAAGRFVFDLWGGRYGESAELLRAAFRSARPSSQPHRRGRPVVAPNSAP